MQEICKIECYAKIFYGLESIKVRNKALMMRFQADLTELS